MPANIRIQGIDDHTKRMLECDVHRFNTVEGFHNGIVTLTEPLRKGDPLTRFFSNASLGINMNQAVAFGSVGVTIHDGGDSTSGDSGTADTDTLNHVIQTGKTFTSTTVVGSYVTGTNTGHVTAVTNTDLTCDADICPNGNEAYTVDPVWVGTAIQGTWNFADSAKITLTSANNNDEAVISAASTANYDWANFTTFTGKVDLDTFVNANHTIVIGFELNGAPVGNTINLNDYISTSDFAEQSFAIPKEDFGVNGGVLFNSIRITLLRSGGAKPTFKLDDLQLEASGSPSIFTLPVVGGTRYYINELIFSFVDASASTLTDGTTPALSYDKFLDLASLNIGWSFRRVIGGVTKFSGSFKNLGDVLGIGAAIQDVISDGTNTMVTLRLPFDYQPEIIDGNSNDSLTIQINDDMSGLTRFTCVARGSLEERQ